MPFSILLPVYYSKFGIGTITYIVFAIMFFSIFIGYVISPVHPCVSVSLEFFGTGLKGFFKKLAVSVIISLCFALAISIIFA